MLFNSWAFLVFFVIVYILYLNLRHRGQNLLLLAASYVFYGWWDWRFTGLMLVSTVSDYVCALAIEHAPTARRRKAWLIVSVSTHLAMLGFFKYYNFFVETAETALRAAGVPAEMLHLDIVLPVGISFYTFQSMTYTIGVYRRELAATRHFLDLALFVSFFPQLMAGPIERARHFLPQVLTPRRALTPGDLEAGLYLIGWGLFKKLIVGDGCAHLVNTVFGNHTAFSGMDHLVAVYAFAFQIYGDFSGYSDMAIGLARLMGFDLSRNFDLPYFARNPSDFWRRWHISLSTWLRDYLYVPLGGSRGSRLMTYRNLMLTMVLGGLWHGAKWTMVVWGAYHGLALVIHRVITTVRPAPPADRDPWPVGKMVLMFHVTCLGWLFFRADSLGQAGAMLTGILTDFRPSDWTAPAFLTLVQLTWLLVVYQVAQHLTGDGWLALRWVPAKRFAFLLAVGYSAAFYWMLNRSLVTSGQPFIYFQF
jgi:D-alanyl-lipoteichoic acid acyltransferase DltB (MBOAT superfamily)